MDGFYAGPALLHYRCFQVVDTTTKSTLISDTVEFRHNYLTQPAITHANRITPALHFLSSALKETPSAVIDTQLESIRQPETFFTTGCNHPTHKFPPHPHPLPLQLQGCPLADLQG